MVHRYTTHTYTNHMSNITTMNISELRTHLRELNREGQITFETPAAQAAFPKFVNGQLGFGINEMQAVAEQRVFPLAGMTLPDTGAGSIPEPRSRPTTSVTQPSLSREAIIREILSLSGVSKEEVEGIVHRVFDERISEGLPERKIIIKNNETLKLEGVAYHHRFELILRHLEAKQNVSMVGPAGVGKTELGSQLAAAMGIPFYCTGKVEDQYELLGFRDAHGVIHKTDFEQAFVHGGLFLFDEFDASNSRAVTRFNSATSNGFCNFPSGLQKAHKDFRVIAASNTWWNGATREYVGRNPFDGATKDRFSFIEVDYDNELEMLLARRWDIGPEICKRVQSVRAALAALKIKHIVSMRATFSMCAIISAGVSKHNAERSTLWKDLSDEQISKIEKHIADGKKGGSNE